MKTKKGQSNTRSSGNYIGCLALQPCVGDQFPIVPGQTHKPRRDRLCRDLATGSYERSSDNDSAK